MNEAAFQAEAVKKEKADREQQLTDQYRLRVSHSFSSPSLEPSHIHTPLYLANVYNTIYITRVYVACVCVCM